MFPSARAKNSENWRECHDLMNIIVEWSEREADTSKRTMRMWSMCNYKGRGLVVGLPELNVSSAGAKNSENQKEYDDVK
jgi:hypothetical protein